MNLQRISDIMSQTPSVATILKNCPYDILNEIEVVDYEKGKIIFEQDMKYDKFCIIASGTVDINTVGENGRKYSYEAYVAGDIVGELEIFSNLPFVSNVEAITKVTMLELSKKNFDRWLELDNSISRYLLVAFAENFYHLSLKAAHESVYSLRHRICNYLLEAYDKINIPTESVELRMDRNLLGERFGVTQRSVNRIMQSLKEKGIIDYNNKFITIRDVKRLRDEDEESRLL